MRVLHLIEKCKKLLLLVCATIKIIYLNSQNMQLVNNNRMHHINKLVVMLLVVSLSVHKL